MRRSVLLGWVAALALAAGGVVPVRAGPVDDARAAALSAGMKTRRISNVKFEATPFEGFLKFMRIATGWNFAVKRAVVQKAGVDLDTATVTLTLDDVAVGTVLDLALEPLGLVAKPEGNIVFVTTKADALGPPVLVLYAITQLTWTKTDFAGPTLDLHPSGYVEPEGHEPEKPVEDDPFTDPAKVVELVKEFVDVPWDSDGWAISATKQILSVKAPRSVQRKVLEVIRVLESMK